MTYDEAKQQAEIEALRDIGNFREIGNEPVLDSRFLEVDNCWMFFQNKNIIIPETAILRKAAYVFSKKGTGRSVADYSEDMKKAEEYLLEMSEYFKERDL